MGGLDIVRPLEVQAHGSTSPTKIYVSPFSFGYLLFPVDFPCRLFFPSLVTKCISPPGEGGRFNVSPFLKKQGRELDWLCCNNKTQRKLVGGATPFFLSSVPARHNNVICSTVFTYILLVCRLFHPFLLLSFYIAQRSFTFEGKCNSKNKNAGEHTGGTWTVGTQGKTGKEREEAKCRVATLPHCHTPQKPRKAGSF